MIHLVNGPCDAALHGLPIAAGAVDAGLQFYPPTADILQSINITVCYLTAESADLHVRRVCGVDGSALGRRSRWPFIA